MKTRLAPEPRIAARSARPGVASRAGRTAAIVAASGLMLALPAAPAFAHAELEPELSATAPAPSSTVAQVPQQVKMTFTSPVAPESTATIVDGCGSIVSKTSNVDGGTVIVAVASDAQPGTWSVRYRNLSLEDGHPKTGDYSFTVSGTADCGTGTAVTGTDPQAPDQAVADAAKPATSAGAWAGLAGFAAAALVAAVAVLVVRRSAGARGA